MINFATLKGFATSKGNVTQIARDGVVLWKLQNNKPAVMQVSKITSDTYAGETTYTGEQFVLLNIYPKTNGTVKVTYGGLTKTVTDTSGAATPNAQTVFFGTFNGVSDSVATPASGTVTIEGDIRTFAIGQYKKFANNKESTAYCTCITGITEWGSIKEITSYAFYNCTSLTAPPLPNGITTIYAYAFYGCSKLALTSLPSSITSINSSAFYNCTSIALTSLPSGITSIGDNAFYNCGSLALTSLPNGIKTIGASAFYGCSITLTSLPDSITNIGKRAFYGCADVDIAVIKVATIGERAFDGTKTVSREPLIISDGVINIGAFAFAHTSESPLEHIPLNITIASTVKTIGRFAFYCGDYGSDIGRIVTMQSATPPTLETDDTGSYKQFDNPAALTKIIVPAGCSAAYKADPSWIAAGYVDKIVEA